MSYDFLKIKGKMKRFLNSFGDEGEDEDISNVVINKFNGSNKVINYIRDMPMMSSSVAAALAVR